MSPVRISVINVSNNSWPFSSSNSHVFLRNWHFLKMINWFFTSNKCLEKCNYVFRKKFKESLKFKDAFKKKKLLLSFLTPTFAVATSDIFLSFSNFFTLKTLFFFEHFSSSYLLWHLNLRKILRVLCSWVEKYCKNYEYPR